MEGIREYILSVVCAAIVCAVLTALSGEKGSAAFIRKLVCGVFLCLTVISPVGKVRLEDLLEPITGIRQDALAVSSMGQTLYQESLAQVIREQTEAYILDKAQGLGLTLSVSVQPDESGRPYRASLVGNAGADDRKTLSDILEKELGIPKERQQWSES